jgi:hypothetical protein
MNYKQFAENALRTESKPDSLQVNPVALHALLSMTIGMANVMDMMKKTMFYGKELDAQRFAGEVLALSDTGTFLRQMAARNAVTRDDKLVVMTHGLQFETVNKRLLHAAIGMFTEAGEMLEALLKQLETGELDKVNFNEELGDSDWYKAIAHDELGTDEGLTRLAVIQKLMKRYPGKFTSEAALDRDLAVEREVLESTFAPVEQVSA